MLEVRSGSEVCLYHLAHSRKNWPITLTLGPGWGAAFCPCSFYGSTNYGPQDGGGLANGATDASGVICWKTGEKDHSLPICGWKRPDLSSGSIIQAQCPAMLRLSLAGNRVSEYYGPWLVTSIFSMVVLSDRPYHHQDGTIAFERSRLGGSWLYKLGSEIFNQPYEVMGDVFLSCRKRRRFGPAWPGFAHGFCRLCWRNLPLQSSPWCFIRSMNLKSSHLNYFSIIMCSSSKRTIYFITATDLQKKSWAGTLAQGCQEFQSTFP